MYDTRVAAEPVTSPRRGLDTTPRRWAGPVARENGGGYDTVAPRPDAEQVLAALDAAVDAVAALGWSGEDDATVNDAAVTLQRLVNRVQAQALRPLAAMDRRESYKRDGAVTAASWLRNRTNMDPPAAARRATAARRLRGLPALRGAFVAGDVSLEHVTAVTEAAVPNRFNAIARVDDTLTQLARTDKPYALRCALRRVRDIVDPHGTPPADTDAGDATGGADPGGDPAAEPPAAGEHDPRRYWHQRRSLDGLTFGEYCIDGVLAEMLTLLFDAFSKADPPDIPLTARRSPAQKRVDAIRAAVMTLLDAGLAPTVQGNKAHLLMMIDLLTIMGRDQAAVFASELRRTGRVSPHTIARLGLDAKITPVVTMGPWRVVAVGRTHRTLPPWLRPMLEMLHRRCRGPDCDRPACWTQAHHQDAYADGGDTDLNTTIPLCQAHHDLVTHAGWTVTLDLDTGICTWTAPDGRIIETYPDR